MSQHPNAKRIALVTAFPPGRQSLNEYGLHLARAFAEQPDVGEVVVIADRLEPGLDEKVAGPGIRVRRVWRFNSLTSLPRILACLRSERVDGVVFNLQMASFGDRELPAALGLLAPMLARWMGIRSGVIAHNLVLGVDLEQTPLRGKPWRQALVRWGGSLLTRALLGANYLTVTLEGYRRALRARCGGGKVLMVPHGTFDTEERAMLPAGQRPMRIVTMGKFGTYKRLETLIEAFGRLRADARLAGLELVIGGSDHPGMPGYMAGVQRLCAGLEGVRFHGYVAEEDIPAFFGSARVSVFDYGATTGSSGVLHQTASYGAVPVFPRIGDFVDICRDEGIAGEHYAPGDAQGMAEAIAALLLDPARADGIASANREAALGMPIGRVAAVHLEQLFAARPGRAAAPGVIQPAQ